MTAQEDDLLLQFVCEVLRAGCARLYAQGMTRTQINAVLPQMVVLANQWLDQQRAPLQTMH